MSYTLHHLSKGEFYAVLETDEKKEIGDNLIGMIRYTYFEDFTLPPDNWSVTREQLLRDYSKKSLADISAGKLELGKHEFGKTDWIEKI